MIASLFSMLPELLASIALVIITWIISRLWYKTRYVHRDEVRPLQESQHIMQNQYAILAERIKHTEGQLIETKSKLELALLAKDEALQEIIALKVGYEQNGIYPDFEQLSKHLTAEIKSIVADINTAPDTGADAEKMKTREQFNLLKQAIKEFKTEFSQKLNAHTSQYHEISNQMWQLLEINKKLSAETEFLQKMLQNPEVVSQDEKSAERQFMLTSIKKRG